MSGIRHLYVHVPFCAHRCGYCDFVTVTGHEDLRELYVDAVLRELEAERHLLADRVETVFLGGGTPTLLGPELLHRLLDGLPSSAETTVEANPETVDQALAEALVAGGANRVSLGAQSFGAAQLAVLERRTTPAQVIAAVAALRAAGIGNLSLDLLFGVPGMTSAEVDRDLVQALELEPDHLSCYELEAKPGTRFTHRHGDQLRLQAEQLEDQYEQVIARLERAGMRWYETANFCRDERRSQHNLAYWTGRDYLGIGIGAVSTIGLARRTNRPSLVRYLATPERVDEQLTREERDRELVMLGLRLDEPLDISQLVHALDGPGLARMVAVGMVEHDGDTLRLTRRGRVLANDVISTLIA